MSKRILVVASTFPASDTDPVPAFVKDQIIAMKAVDPTIQFDVLAPHDIRSNTTDTSKHPAYTEHRFHYFWPFTFEKLAGRGIMPAIKANPLYYLLIPFLFVGEGIALYHLTRHIRPHYIYAHWFTPQGVMAALVSKMTATPYVLTTHASDVDVWHKIPFLGTPIVRWGTTQASAITAVSRRSLNKLQRFFEDPQWDTSIAQKTTIIPMGVHAVNPSASISTEQLKKQVNLSGQTVLYFMGRLAEKKGVSYLIDAFAKIDDTNCTLVIAGDGPLRQSLQDQASRLGVADRVRFTGFLSGEQKQSYMQLADLVILPSIIADDGDAEGLPVVFMEALAAGKICIATNESGADDIITHTESGFLIPQKDSNAITSAIAAARSLTEDERRTLQQAARSAAKQFDWQHIATRHLEFFNSRLNED